MNVANSRPIPTPTQPPPARSRPPAADPPRGGRPDATARRLALTSLEAAAADAGDSRLAAALARLSLMHDVAECLDAGAIDEVEAFNSDAFDRLTAMSDLDVIDQAATWVLAESSARWGEYLALIDPTSIAVAPPAVPDPDPPVDDEPAAIDATTLLRLLGGEPSTADQTPTVGRATPRPDPPPQGGREAEQGPPAEGEETKKSPPPLWGRVGWGVDSSPPVAPAEAVPARSAPTQSPGSIPPPPTTLSIDPELRDVFLAEAADLFERIESGVLTLRPGPGQGAALHELGRCLHTLKGAAGSVDLRQLAAVVHATEDRLEAAAGTVTPAEIDLLHELLGYFEGVFAALKSGEPDTPPAPTIPPAPPAAVVDTPRPPVPATPPHPPTPTPTPTPTPAPAPARESTATEGPVRVSSERVDELMDIASELIGRRGLWSAQTEAMKGFATQARGCRARVNATVDRLRDLLPGPGRPAPERGADLDEEVRRLAEQVDDLVVLLDSTQAAAKPLSDSSDALARQTLLLWDALQSIRIIPVRGLFQRLIRVAHDAARVEGREVEVVTRGDDVGLDRAVQDKAFEPLLHVVRNAVGHGIEPPEERLRVGKPAAGRVTFEAARSGNAMVLTVQDDGRGLDLDAIAAKGRRLGLIGPDERPSDDRLNALIFQPGFSTRDAANSVSGRGVGMDVVSQEVGKLHGSIALASKKGQGVRLTITLPARLALEQAMILRVDGRAFALPVDLVEKALTLDEAGVDRGGPVPRLRVGDELVPMVDAREALGCASAPAVSCPKVLLVRFEAQPLAVVVDAIDGTRELVVRPLGPLLAGHPLISGTSLSATGEVIFALSAGGLARRLGGAPRRVEPGRGGEAPRALPVLVVDDSISVRRAAVRQLRALGRVVVEASDGLEALRMIRTGSFALVLSDLEMPRMDGFELLAELGRLAILPGLPVLVASTRSDPATRRRVLGLGARAFLAKPIDPDELAARVGELSAPRAGAPGP